MLKWFGPKRTHPSRLADFMLTQRRAFDQSASRIVHQIYQGASFEKRRVSKDHAKFELDKILLHLQQMSRESKMDQKTALEEENRVAEALLKLSVNSSRESQRLQAIKTSWTSKIRAQENGF